MGEKELIEFVDRKEDLNHEKGASMGRLENALVAIRITS
jgi:hypothetical protein